MKCYDCVWGKASTGVAEIEIQDAYTMFAGEPICFDHLIGKLSVVLSIGWNVVRDRLTPCYEPPSGETGVESPGQATGAASRFERPDPEAG